MKNVLILTILIIIYFFILNYYEQNNDRSIKKNNFDYINYENFIITKEMEKNAGWMFMTPNQYYFINGIIRKHKPKNCLEVGVAGGGSSILILNAIKDIKDSKLISLDLNIDLYDNKEYKTGYRVKKYFPELSNRWQLFTGRQPHIFLQKLKMNFDFVFLDTAHISPGEILNLIEILPFLKENAIIIIHDIIWHFMKENNNANKRFSTPNIYLISALYGDKIIIKNNEGLENIGAIFLYKNQKNHYLNYFLLLLGHWEYMPSDDKLEEIRIFIKKYYKKDLYSLIFNYSVTKNKIFLKKKKFLNN